MLRHFIFFAYKKIYSDKILKHSPMLLILVLIAIFEIGFIDFKSYYSTNRAFELIFQRIPWYQKIHLLPLIILYYLNFPLSIFYVYILLLEFYHIVSGLLMYLFTYEFLRNIFREKRENILIFPSIIAMFVFMYNPWGYYNNYLMLSFIFSTTPLYLLLILKFIKNHSAVLFVSISIFFSIMQWQDPRAFIWISPLTFLLLVFPEIIRKTEIKEQLKTLGLYILHLILVIVLSSPDILRRLFYFGLGERIVPINVPTPFVINNFLYQQSTVLNVLRGVNFFGVYNLFKNFETGLPTEVSYIFIVSQLFIAIVSILTILHWRELNNRVKLYVCMLLFILILSISLFTKISYDMEKPLFVNLLFNLPHIPLTEVISTAFRTSRFISLWVAVIFSLLVAINVKLLFDKSHIGDIRFKIITAIIIILIILNVISWAVPLITNERYFGFGPPIGRTIAYDKAANLLQSDFKENRTLALMPKYINAPYTFPVESSIYRFYYAYALDPFTSPVIKNKDYDFLSWLLKLWGIKYLIIDGYKYGRYNEFLTTISDNDNYKYLTSEGKLHIFKIVNTRPITLGYPLIVVGGFESYREARSILNGLNNSVPIFIDSPISPKKISNINGYILWESHKSMLDLAMSFILYNETAIIISPANILRRYDPSKIWSPGYVADPFAGFWTWNLPNFPNYEWSYSYRPEYGYAHTKGHDNFKLKFKTPIDGTYQILLRILGSPKSGTIEITLDGVVSKRINTKLNYTSEFIWIDFGKYNLTKGEHFLNVKNIEGYNAINIVVVVPEETLRYALQNAINLIYNNTVVIIMPIMGDSNGSTKQENGPIEIQGSFYVPKDGRYSLKIKTPELKSDSDIVVFIDEKKIKIFKKENFTYVTFESIWLNNGRHIFKIISPVKSFNSGIIIFYPPDTLLNGISPCNMDTLLSAKLISVNVTDTIHRKYSVRVISNGPFLLTIPEAYDGMWIAESDTKVEISTFPVAYIFTGFYIVPKVSQELQLTIYNYSYNIVEFYSIFILVSILILVILAIIIDLVKK